MSAETQVSFPEDATHTEEVFFFGSRGVALSELRVRFQVRSERARWHELLTKLNLEVAQSGGISSAAFAALPERLERFRPFLTAMVAWDDYKPGTTTWDFRWRRSENDSPPASLVESSRAVGGFPSVLDQLGAWWPVNVPVKARISASYFIFDEDWRFTLGPTQVQKFVVEGQLLSVRPSLWRVSPPSGCVSKVSQWLDPGSEKDFILQGRGTYHLKWSPHFLNEVDGAVWDGLKIFLKPRRSKPKR